MTNEPVAHHTPLNADLVLSGGGVKGIGLVGAIVALMEAEYSFQRVSGTSAGSIVGAILAAGSRGNQLTPDEIKQLAMNVPYRKFLDPTPITGIPLLGPAWGVLSEEGIYKGDFAHGWIRSQLKNLGVCTFGDLAVDDEHLLPERRYRLVVTVADVTTGQMVRLPWDYRRLYGLDPRRAAGRRCRSGVDGDPVLLPPSQGDRRQRHDVHVGRRRTAIEFSD